MQRRDQTSVPVSLPGKEDYAAIFTRSQIATAYMVERGETIWETRMVVRGTIEELVAELRDAGMRGFCVNATGRTFERVLAFHDLVEKQLGRAD